MNAMQYDDLRTSTMQYDLLKLIRNHVSRYKNSLVMNRAKMQDLS